ncbi:MAPEG family protein [Pleionea sediminis]|uniref:MAPEG family protein n=1 Tax=Pleionea sediminis TaxID=2569479 RepID=UPI001184AFA5|nr:MAPEG family protein [Pleionea sediminis]
MLFPIAALYGSLCGVLILVLAFQVVRLRRRLKVGIGDGSDHQLKRSIRVHSNAVEYIPTALVLLAFFEANGGFKYLAHVAGMLLVLGRVLHAQGLGSSHGTSFGRFWGTCFTWLSILILSIANLVMFF